MSERLTDEELVALASRVGEHVRGADAFQRDHGVRPLGITVDPATVAALVREVQELRAREAKRQHDQERLREAIKNKTAIPLGRAGWMLPPEDPMPSTKE